MKIDLIRKSACAFIAAACLFPATISAGETTEAKVIKIPDATYMYAERDTCELFMDVYNPAAGSPVTFEGKTKPTVLFMFGGGFKRGTRDDESYHKWFKQLNDNGYRVISIDYRLGLKNTEKVGIFQVNVLDAAIHLAVEDLFSATNFIIDNAEQLGVDPSSIIISGSSAGAMSVMQAEYEIANRTSWASVLPEGFNYAGVMSFSGAIFSREGKVDFADKTCPVLMFHGTADKLVPYKQIAVLHLGLYGGGKIVDRLRKYDFNYNMYHFVDYGHEIAGSMDTTTDLQFDFIETNVMQGKKRIIEAWISDPDVWKGYGPQSRKEVYGK